MREWVKKVKGLRNTDWELQNSHRDIEFSLGNVVNIVIIIMVPGGY